MKAREQVDRPCGYYERVLHNGRTFPDYWYGDVWQSGMNDDAQAGIRGLQSREPALATIAWWQGAAMLGGLLAAAVGDVGWAVVVAWWAGNAANSLMCWVTWPRRGGNGPRRKDRELSKD